MDIKEILKWFKKAVPEPTIETACVQIGCHYEEVSEMAQVLGDADLCESAESVGFNYKSRNIYYISDLESLLTLGKSKVELLDSLCDQIVTAVGVAHMLDMDIEGALTEVNSSNWSKFENGSPVFDESGKIKKGGSYFKPELSKFIDTNIK